MVDKMFPKENERLIIKKNYKIIVKFGLCGVRGRKRKSRRGGKRREDGGISVDTHSY